MLKIPYPNLDYTNIANSPLNIYPLKAQTFYYEMVHTFTKHEQQNALKTPLKDIEIAFQKPALS
ncbi:hypothetical protein [Brevinema andersonii]|nr:hypothetical protein [Brevinema andersonii]